ncbi:hypothetical protein BDN67DRAFT_992712 [Paxillus ammoniavirescens]|nr:hypothetical protein BDN67DRAFT_992712 [Paxillus ammoniavirescens]
MAMGFFGCAPITPSLAVDLRLLQFVKTLFVRLTPNTTAWCEALAVFLQQRGYGLTTQENLRRRFSNAYHWYIVLVVHNKELVSGIINASRSHNAHEASDGEEEEGGGGGAAKDPQQLQNPSDYLRSRCPLCFGGLNWRKERDSLVDVIVCIDTCFTQKHSKNPRGAEGHDPLNPTSSVFIPSEAVTQMEVHVECCRSKGKERGWRVLRPSEDEDRVEEGMRVPASVLDGCGESFVAADEKREKASTHFFADTGLMALLCRHDHMLWLVNMTSAGEKQHYALALIQKLMEHLPNHMRVGLLYDIGCQLERSWRKFKFFENSILSRFHFAISVFHAYGHQWPCQVVYHPRKWQGFGLSDGEGCERLWSALKPLIGPLRVSGYHQRLFVLDLQVHHLDAKSCLGYGNWLSRRWSNWSCSVLEETLRSKWAAQVVTQTRPAPRQSKHKADEEISKIIELEKLVGACAQMVRTLELRFISNQIHDGLGVTGRAKLAALRGNVFLQVRMNALAVKTQIRDRLRQHKFELERIERAYHQMVGDQRLCSHAEASVKHREPTLLRLVTAYNGLCNKLMTLIQQWKAVRGAVMPHYIPREGLFELDVDDDIWQDVGLTGGEAEPPAWLADDKVRMGIRDLLEKDQCIEEEMRLRREHCNLQEWCQVEWEATHLCLLV